MRVPSRGPEASQQGLSGGGLRNVAPQGAFGGDTRAHLSVRGLLGEIQNKVDRDKQRDNRTAVTEAMLKYSARKQDYLWNEESGYFTKGARDAAEVNVDGDLAAFGSDISQSLTNDAQRKMFLQRVMEDRAAMHGKIEKHLFDKRREELLDTTDARLANLRNDSIMNYDDPALVGLNLAEAGAALFDVADEFGHGKEWLENEMRKYASGTHVQILNRMLSNGQDLTAKEYLKANRDDMASDDVVAAERIVNRGARLGKAQRVVDDMLRQKLTEKEALFKAREEEDPELRRMTVAAVKERFAEQREIYNLQQNQWYEELLGQMGDFPNVSPDKLDPLRFDALDAKYQDAVKRRFNEPPASDQQAWLNLVDMARTNPVKLGTMTRADFEARYWSRFDGTDRKRAETMWLQASQVVAKAEGANAKLVDLLTPTEIVKTTLAEADLIPRSGSLSGTDQKKLDAFRKEMQRRMDLLGEDGIKRLGDGDVRRGLQALSQTMASEMVTRQGSWWNIIPGGAPFWDEDVRRFSLDKDLLKQTSIERVDQVPMEILEHEIKVDIQGASGTYSDAKAVRLYNAFLKGDAMEYNRILTERDIPGGGE